MSPPPPRPPTSASSRIRHSTVPPAFPSSSPSSPLFDAVVSAFFEQLRNSVTDFSESSHWRMVGGWQARGIPDEVIYDTLKSLFPLHGSPLTLYEELYVPALSGKGSTPIRQTKPTHFETHQMERQMRIQQQRQPKASQSRKTLATATSTTPLMYPKPPPAPGMLHQLLLSQQSLDASINANNNKAAVVINVGDYVNVRSALSQGFYSRGGNGYVACKETVVNSIDFVFTVAYVNAFLSGGQTSSATESKITRDRLTILPPYLALGNSKQGIGTPAPTQRPQSLSGDTYIHSNRLLSPGTNLSAELKPIHRLAAQKLVLAPAPFSVGRPKRQREGSTVTDGDDNNDNHETTHTTVDPSPPTRLSGHENLAEYLQKSHSLHRPKGWRQDDFPELDVAVASVKRELLLQDVMWMEHHLNLKGRRKGPKQARGVGDSFCSYSFVRNSKSNSNSNNNNDDNDNDDSNRSEKIHPLTMRYLAYSWGVGKNTPKELLKRVNVRSVGAGAPGGSSNTNNPEVWKQRSVIECRKTALKHYSAKHLYIRHRITERRRLSMQQELEKDKKNEDDDDENENDDASSSGSFLAYQYRKDIKEEWDALDQAGREPWERKATWHDEMQPSVQQILVAQINNHPYRTYNDLAMDIGDWCGASTIQRWLTAKRASCNVE